MAAAELLGRGVDEVAGEGEAVTVLVPQPAKRTASAAKPTRVPVMQAETLLRPGSLLGASYSHRVVDGGVLLDRQP